MSDKIKMILIVFMGCMLAFLIFNFGVRYHQNRTIILGLQDSVQVSAISSIDYKARADKGTLLLDKPQFESSVKSEFKRSISAQSADTIGNFQFSYVDDPRSTIGGIKSITVKCVVNSKQVEATWVLDDSVDR